MCDSLFFSLECKWIGDHIDVYSNRQRPSHIHVRKMDTKMLKFQHQSYGVKTSILTAQEKLLTDWALDFNVRP